MKFSSILAGSFATVVAATPFQGQDNNNNGLNIDLSQVDGLGFDLSQFNDLQFNNELNQYLFNLNSESFLLSPVLELAVNNGFNFNDAFGNLFLDNSNNDLANIEQLLLFQQLQTFAAIAATGALSGFQLNSLDLNGLNLGALGNSFSSFDLNSLVNSQASALIQPVLAQAVVIL